MNWLSKLMRKPDAKPAAQRPPSRAASPAPAVDAAAGLTPQPEDPPAVWVAAICSGADKALALAWTAGLAGDDWLGEVAAQARFAEVRLAAAQRIEASAVLERIAQLSRDKDRGVYRHCAERLRQRRQADERRRRAGEIAAALRALLAGAPLPLSRIVDLEHELRALGDDVDALAECTALLAAAHARLQQESIARRDVQDRQAAAAQLLAECTAAEASPSGRLADWRTRFDALAQAQRGLPGWLAANAAARALAETLREIESRLADFAADRERFDAAEAFLAALAAGTPIDTATAAAWAALAKPADPAARQSLEARWQALQPRPEPLAPVAPPTPVTPRPSIDHDTVRRGLEQLEQHVAAGHLADADAAAKAIADALGGNSLHGALESRLHRASAQLGELRGWARWGGGQAREHLIASAEALADGASGSAAGVDDLATGVPALREEWKRLNDQAPATKAQWQRFDAALEKAYQPVLAQKAEDAARLAAACAVKEALCAEIEAASAGIVWENADYKLIDGQRQALVSRWRAAPAAGFRDERVLRKRFDKLLAAIDQKLDAVRAAEVERRRQLIAAAELVREAPDHGGAIAQIRALQDKWRQQAGPLRLSRGDEQKLWQRFRAACDAVFARRDARRAEHDAQREERAQVRRGLLDAFAETLAAADANAIKPSLERFRADWGATQEAGRENTRAAADGLDARARSLQQEAQQRLDALRHAKHRAHFDLLAQKAALAVGVEAAAVAQLPPESVAAAKEAWDGLPRLPGKAETLLAERFARAPGATAAGLAAGHAARETLILDLEIALGLPSPEACAESRRRRQLERLQNRFGAGLQAAADADAMLVQCYATSAAPDAALDQRLAAVVGKLVEQAAGGSGERQSVDRPRGMHR